MRLLHFLVLAFSISLAGFLGVAIIPGADSPESATGLPFWLIMVWGPSLAAIVLSARKGELKALLGRAVRVSTVPVEAWALCLGPLILFALLSPFAPDEGLPVGLGVMAASIAFNLVLGPMGEELGWRGVMQERLNRRTSWLRASLLVALAWLLWHLPLWTVDSPHSQISLPLFSVHCALYAILIGAVYTLSGGSILPAILTHLTVNLAANWAIFAGYGDPNAWFEASLWHYAALAAGAIAIVHAKRGPNTAGESIGNPGIPAIRR